MHDKCEADEAEKKRLALLAAMPKPIVEESALSLKTAVSVYLMVAYCT